MPPIRPSSEAPSLLGRRVGHLNPLTLNWRALPGHYWLLTLELFAFWIVLTESLEGRTLALGAAVALVVAFLTHPLFYLPPAISTTDRGPGMLTPWPRLLRYLPWLLKEIVVSNFQIAWIVLHPRLPISPRLVRFTVRLPHAFARATLANSITLTPGTITVDQQGDQYLVHALTEKMASGLRPEDPRSMPGRVTRVFTRDRRGRRKAR